MILASILTNLIALSAPALINIDSAPIQIEPTTARIVIDDIAGGTGLVGLPAARININAIEIVGNITLLTDNLGTEIGNSKSIAQAISQIADCPLGMILTKPLIIA